MATGQYFQALEKWTFNRDDAYDFGFVSRAMRVAHKLHIPDLELELSFDDSEPAPATPFEHLLRGLSRSRNHRASSRPTSRQPALA